MRTQPAIRAINSLAVAVAVAVVLTAMPVHAQSRSDKPLLSTEIRTVFETSGAAAAGKRYEDIARSHEDEYEFDLAGMMDIGEAYSLAGDHASAQVFLLIASRMSRREITRSPMMAGFTAMRDSAARADSARNAAAAREPPAESPQVDAGPPRRDLARFHGVYGDPAQQKYPRNVFVIEDCAGRLQFGAMWGDVAPWTMKSLGDAQFAQSSSTSGKEPIQLQFHVSPERTAIALTHTLTFGKGPVRVPRLKDLPADWKLECTQGQAASSRPGT